MQAVETPQRVPILFAYFAKRVGDGDHQRILCKRVSSGIDKIQREDPRGAQNHSASPRGADWLFPA